MNPPASGPILAQPDSSWTESARALLGRIRTHEATIAIVGLGYVGLPLAYYVHRAGYRVIGFDNDLSKIEALRRGTPYLKHLGDELTITLSKSDRFVPTSRPQDLRDADVCSLCVPTPLGKHLEPDLSYVLDSTRLVAENARPGQLVVLESTTYPGTTRDEMLPVLESRGLRCGSDVFVAYSPEREDPGRKDANTATIPKLVGGIDPVSGAIATEFYSRVIDRIHPVSSAEVAEAAKVVENIYRSVNIAMVNELKIIFDAMGIDVWQVIEAASTKPFGFQAFYPGPGLGGHCIPIDPYYLTWKAREVGYRTRFIELAGEINHSMPRYVVERVAEALNGDQKSVRGASVVVVGIAYKPNVDDTRESPAAEIIELLQARGARVQYHDPLVPNFPIMRDHRIELQSLDLTPDTLRSTDCVVVVTDHDVVDYRAIVEHAPLVVDTRNAIRRLAVPRGRARVVRA